MPYVNKADMAIAIKAPFIDDSFVLYQRLMGQLKNPRHELFVHEYIAAGCNAAEAYRQVNAKIPWKRTGINNPNNFKQQGFFIKERPDVQRRIQEVRMKLARKADITMEKILTDYQEALELAKAQAKPNEIVTAATAQAKLVGLLRDRVETGGAGEFDDLDNYADIIAKVRDEVGPEAALALAKAFGLDEAETAEKEEASELMDKTPPSDSVN